MDLRWSRKEEFQNQIRRPLNWTKTVAYFSGSFTLQSTGDRLVALEHSESHSCLSFSVFMLWSGCRKSDWSVIDEKHSRFGLAGRINRGMSINKISASALLLISASSLLSMLPPSLHISLHSSSATSGLYLLLGWTNRGSICAQFTGRRLLPFILLPDGRQL